MLAMLVCQSSEALFGLVWARPPGLATESGKNRTNTC